MMIMKTQTNMITKLCCMFCENNLMNCSSCGKAFGISENIGCSRLPDGKHYCEDCTMKISMETLGCEGNEKNKWKGI